MTRFLQHNENIADARIFQHNPINILEMPDEGNYYFFGIYNNDVYNNDEIFMWCQEYLCTWRLKGNYINFLSGIIRIRIRRDRSYIKEQSSLHSAIKGTLN